MTERRNTNRIMQGLAAAGIFGIAIATMAIPASAEKLKGDTTLKDSQPYGTPDKEHKHQGYELLFNAQGKGYSCRTNPKKSMDATDFVVGSQIHYEIDKNKAKIKTPAKKEVECKIVRVEQIPATQ
jgi:hypothetical protein